MPYSALILGAPIARQLQERAGAAVLTIGKDRFTRGDLATVSSFNYIAAARLSAYIADLGVKDTKDLYQRFGPSAFAAKGIGAISLAVLGACLELKGLSLEEWVLLHATAGRKPLVTFSTIKARDAAARAREKKDARRRRRSLTTSAAGQEAIH